MWNKSLINQELAGQERCGYGLIPVYLVQYIQWALQRSSDSSEAQQELACRNRERAHREPRQTPVLIPHPAPSYTW